MTMARKPSPKKPTKRHGRNKEQQEYLDRTFKGLPVVDAKEDLRIPITTEAMKRGKKMDPENCVAAVVCRENFGSSAAVFFKTVAYVDVIGGDKKHRVERFVLSEQMREFIEAFDRDEKVDAVDAWLVLKAPPRGKQLEYTRKKNRKYREAKAKGSYVPKGPARAGQQSKRSKPGELEIRKGSGQWQMIQSREAAAA
jgi:hypothetical protein